MLVYHPYDNKNCLMAQQMSFIFYVGATEENKTALKLSGPVKGPVFFFFFFFPKHQASHAERLRRHTLQPPPHRRAAPPPPPVFLGRLLSTHLRLSGQAEMPYYGCKSFVQRQCLHQRFQ